MGQYFSQMIASMNTKDAYVRIGFPAGVVKITKISDGQDNIWCASLGNDGALVRAAAGDRTVTTDKGIKLVKFTETAIETTSAPAVVDPNDFRNANGIMITSDVAFLADDTLILVEAWGLDYPFIKITHDGGASHLFVEDASYDFRDIGIGDAQTWMIYNQSNGDYAYIKEVQKPADKPKYCRLLLAENSDGDATAAADIADADVLYAFPASAAWYPMSDIGAMT